MNLIFLLILIVTGIIVVTVLNIKIGKERRLSEEKTKKEDHEAAQTRDRLVEEDMVEQREVRKLRAETEETERKDQIERKLKEEE